MAKIATVSFLIILGGIFLAGAQQADTSETNWDWLGVRPIYSYGDIIYPYYYVPHSYVAWPKYADTFWYYPWIYGQPYYYPPYFAWKYPTNAWWIGTHEDLPKALAIARSGSSVRVYSHGLWQTP